MAITATIDTIITAIMVIVTFRTTVCTVIDTFTVGLLGYMASTVIDTFTVGLLGYMACIATGTFMPVSLGYMASTVIDTILTVP